MSINEEGPEEPGAASAGDSEHAGTPGASSEHPTAPGSGVGANSGGHSSRAFGTSGQSLSDLDDAVAALEALELIERQVAAARVNALALADRAARCEALKFSKNTAAEDSVAYRAARAEIAAALHFSEQTIERHLTEAKALSTQYAATVSALESGIISYRHATVILRAGEVIGENGIDDTNDIATQRTLYEERVLMHATNMTPNRLTPIARLIAEEYATRDLDERYESEREFRRVWVAERDNGMAELGAYLPAHEAYGIHSRLTQIAKQIESVERNELRERENCVGAAGAAGMAGVTAAAGASPEDLPRLRRRDEIRADLFSDFLLNSTGDAATGTPGVGISGITGIVQIVTHTGHVQENALGRPSPEAQSTCHQEIPPMNTSTMRTSTMPTSTMHRRQVPELEGYGPIAVGVARNIAGSSSSWNLITANPATGDVLRVDRYRPSEEMRRYLTARDQHCRFPGCRGAAYRGDTDHTIDAALGGETSTSNLGILCRGHHTLKHHSGWKVKQRAYGLYEWTSPTGRVHIDTPVSRLRFAAPPSPPGKRLASANIDPPPPQRETAPSTSTAPPSSTASLKRQNSEEPEIPF